MDALARRQHGGGSETIANRSVGTWLNLSPYGSWKRGDGAWDLSISPGWMPYALSTFSTRRCERSLIGISRGSAQLSSSAEMPLLDSHGNVAHGCRPRSTSGVRACPAHWIMCSPPVRAVGHVPPCGRRVGRLWYGPSTIRDAHVRVFWKLTVWTFTPSAIRLYADAPTRSADASVHRALRSRALHLRPATVARGAAPAHPARTPSPPTHSHSRRRVRATPSPPTHIVNCRAA